MRSPIRNGEILLPTPPIDKYSLLLAVMVLEIGEREKTYGETPSVPETN